MACTAMTSLRMLKRSEQFRSGSDAILMVTLKFGAKCSYLVRNSRRSMRSSRCREKRHLQTRVTVLRELCECSIPQLSHRGALICFHTTSCVETKKCFRLTGKTVPG